ncbi:MAG: GGDEF domain-containing protein [Steroidobacteraceae bacterium]|nr:GGDEF domain-containing protein [Steroidobacteraceae bacterium]
MMPQEMLQSVLDWESALLTADSFAAWLEAAANPPGAPDEELAVSLILADPTDELRHLTVGAGVLPQLAMPVAFVDSLEGRAPQLGVLHAPWCGEYRAADHDLLFQSSLCLTQLLMLPLRRGGRLIGTYSVGSCSAMPGLALAEAGLLGHVATVLSASVDRLVDRARLLRGSFSDPLTGWNSARYLQARLREEVARCQRYGGSVACLVVDVDRLQQVNDRHGQPAGDLVLREIAGRIESQVRASDATARIGSDEFGVVLPSTDGQQAIPLARRILAAVSRSTVGLGDGIELRLTVSMGIAAIEPARNADRKALADHLVANAVAAMHRAKERGGGAFEITP